MDLDWRVFCRDTIDGEFVRGCLGDAERITYLDWLLSAWGWTLSVAALAWIVAIAAGAVVGVLRTTPHRPLVILGNAWTELFRNIPVLVQVFLWYHVIPALFPLLRAIPSFLLVVVALGLYTSARISEQVRAGIQSIPQGQRLAALALGFTLPQVYRHVLLPQAWRIVLPPLTSESMNIIKNSSVAFAVSIPELTLFALQAQEETARGIEIYLIVTGLYFFSALLVNRILHIVEMRLRIPGLIVVTK
ncbi:MAG: amino acid ABC transporter permease [Rhodocyclaceae bacterium]|nr:amino acid ABC transporter permease [Rhodocyclaceae bacterium]